MNSFSLTCQRLKIRLFTAGFIENSKIGKENEAQFVLIGRRSVESSEFFE